MTNLAHIGETALLLLSAYLLGCILGYATRRILHAARGTRQVAAVAAPVATPVPALRRPAARLAASVEDLPPAKPVVIKPSVKPPGRTKSPDSRPAALSVARHGGADNLKKIKGIGPKIEALLHTMGIFHIDQIAGWSKTNIEWVDAELAFKGRIRRERWVEQALELSRTRASA